MKAYRVTVLVFGAAFVAIGIALLVRTALAGGGAVGYMLSGLFVAFGAGRLTLELRRRAWSS